MKTLTIYELVKALVGPIIPVGEANADEARFENLKETIELIELLIRDVGRAAESKDRHEFSMKKIGKEAHDFLTEHFRTPYEGD